MPGVEACGRCGARLDLASAAVDVYPPRAGRWSKRWRRVAPVSFRFQRWQHQVTDAIASRVGTLALPRSATGAFARIIVPGWPQIYRGQRTRGRIFLFGYVGTLILGTFFAGTLFGGILLGLAISLHASSVLDVVMGATTELSTRVLYALACFLALAVGLYWPVGWQIGQLAVPLRITANAPPFQIGDVLWYGPAAYRSSPPQVGDVVLYLQRTFEISGRTPRGHHAVYRMGGERIDRVVAGPGQQVEWAKGGLLVDGQRSPWRPLGPAPVPIGWKRTVPAGWVCILPSTTVMPPGAAGWSVEDFGPISIVPIANVRGKVYFRSQPLWRIGMIR